MADTGEEKKMMHMDEVVEKVLERKGSSLYTIKRLVEKKIENADRSEIGTLMKVNEYAVTAELARGSFGAVYLAEVSAPPTDDDPEPPPKCFAMKTFLKPKSKSLMRGPGRGKKNAVDEELAVIRKEISMMKRIRHPHIVSLLEVIEETKPPHSIYMIMEHVEGGDSMIMVKRQDDDMDCAPSFVCPRSHTVMGEAQASKVFRQLISAMAYLHLNKIAHRDLKPENLLLTASGDLKLVDFGVSEDFSSYDDQDNGKVANTKGSWPFFSPEMVDADEDNKYDAYKADVWAAASCLWVFVFGVLPFWQPHDPNNPQPIFDKLIEAKSCLPRYPSRKSPELYELLEKMFTADPVQRPPFNELEQYSWIKLHTTGEIEFELNIAATNIVLADEDVDDMMETHAGDVSTISRNIKDKMINLALKSKLHMNAREEIITRERNTSISDKKEVRKSLTKVYTPESTEDTPKKERSLKPIPSFAMDDNEDISTGRTSEDSSVVSPESVGLVDKENKKVAGKTSCCLVS